MFKQYKFDHISDFEQTHLVYIYSGDLVGLNRIDTGTCTAFKC